MAEVALSARATSTNSVVYTVPAGKTAEVLSLSIANITTPEAETELTLTWFDASDGGSGTSYQFLTSVRFPASARLQPMRGGFVMHAGDRLSVTPATGQFGVVLSLDVIP